MGTSGVVEGWASATNKTKVILKVLKTFPDGPRELVQETNVRNICRRIEVLETPGSAADNEHSEPAKSLKRGACPSWLMGDSEPEQVLVEKTGRGSS